MNSKKDKIILPIYHKQNLLLKIILVLLDNSL
jgi:hypothetical protein